MPTGYICNGSMTIEEREEKIRKAVELFRAGQKVPDIAEALDCDRTTVYKWLHLKHIKVSDNRKYSVDLIDQIADMYQTMTRAEIARKLGIDYPVVQYIINSNYIRKGELL